MNSVSREESLLVVGMGMIGGSVLLSACAAGSARHILGFDRDSSTMQTACEQGVIENSAGQLRDLAAQASLIVIAAPPSAFAEIFAELASAELNSACVISDVASVKSPVISACIENAPALMPRFIPAHPIAGSEQSGFSAAKNGLFYHKKLILTPHDQTSAEATRRGEAFWSSLDCFLAILGPELHDELLASTSHLPHVLAYVLVDSLLGHQHIGSLFEFAAGGFQDISRTASSDPTMWRDIFMLNKDKVLDAVEAFEGRLSRFKQLLNEGRSDELFAMLEHAKQGRDDYLAKYRS